MKNFIITLFIIFFNCYLTLSQATKKDTLKFPLDKMKVNFAVPDIPAFKSLGIEPSTILRPSTPEALSIIVPQFFNNGSITLPSSFALEASPSLLLNSNRKYLPTLDETIKARVWNSLRVSLATAKDSTKAQPNAMKLGIGLRISLIDKGDLKYDKGFIAKKGFILSEGAVADFEDDDLYIQKNNMSMPDLQKANIKDSIIHLTVQKLRFYQAVTNIPMKEVLVTSDSTIEKLLKENEYKEGDLEILKSNRDSLAVKLKGKSFEDKQALFLQQLQNLKEEYKKNNWNAERLDLAMSVVWRSPDNFAKSLEYNKLSLWLTYAMPCKKWGQLLLGINGSNASILEENSKENKNFNIVSLSSRLYAGTNEMKGFVETQYSRDGLKNVNNYFFQLGGEFAVRDGVWLQVYGGYQKGDKISQVVSSLDLRFTLPEK